MRAAGPFLAFCCLLAALVGAQMARAEQAAPAAAPVSPVEVSLSRSRVSTDLGKSFDFTSTITNRGPAPLAGLVAHLNVLSFTHGVYVDPEDWSSHRTRYLDPLPSGRSVTLDWTVKAVTGGDMGIYVAVLGTPSAGATPGAPTVSPTLEAHVTEHRTINPGGVVPLALGIPAALALAMAAVRVRRRSLRL
jgi:hypothetical protein